MFFLAGGGNPLSNFYRHDFKGADMDQLTCEHTLKHFHALGCNMNVFISFSLMLENIQ